MYNPNQDIVAGRTAKQIEAAKRRAVKGGGRKRCKKGKSCGSTCINGSKVCLVDLPWVSSQGLSKVAMDIQSRPTVLPSAEIRSLIREMSDLYKGVKEINDSNMPHVEQDWRRKELEGEIDIIRGKVEVELNKLGASRDKALQKFRDKEEEFKTGALSRGKLISKVYGSLRDIQTLVGMLAYSKPLADSGDDYHRSKASILVKKIEGDKRRIRTMISSLSDARDRDDLTRRLGLIVGDVKGLSVGSLEETARVGKEFMGRYRERLNSAFSILRRQELARISIEAKLKDGDLSLKEKQRLRKSLLRMDSLAARANERSYRLMEEIRMELLTTKLSVQEVQSIMSRIRIASDTLPADSPLIGQVRSQVVEFARMFNGKGLLESVEDGKILNHLRTISINPAERAFSDKGFIQVSGEKRVTFHEIAHIVEDGRGWLGGYAERWRDGKAYSVSELGRSDLVRRENGEIIPYSSQPMSGRNLPVFRLAEMPPLQGRGYSPNETAVVDKFMTPYMGKVYPREGQIATEVISVGMEKFASHQDMRRLFMDHPDLFETIVGLALT